MTQQEETVSVAKSTIIFKTTDEWFKTLVSGVVETFFPDKELTFSIEIRKYRTDRQGWCYAWEKPSRIIIIHKHINDGLELANTIAHEIIHTFTEGREAIFGKGYVMKTV